MENGLAAFLQAQVQTKILEESVAAYQKAVNIADEAYQAGTTWTSTVVATILQTLVEREQHLAQAQGDIAQGLIQTYLALGGGWEIRCTPQDNRQPLGPIVPPPEAPAKPVMPPSLMPLAQPPAAAPEVLPAPCRSKTRRWGEERRGEEGGSCHVILFSSLLLCRHRNGSS